MRGRARRRGRRGSPAGGPGAHFVTTWHGTYSEDLPFKRHYNAVMARGERVIAASRFIAELIVARHGDRSGAHPRHPARGRSRGVRSQGGARAIGWRGCCASWRLPDGVADRAAARAADQLEGAGGADRGARPDGAARRVLRAGGVRPGPPALCRGGWSGRRRRSGIADRVRLVGECDDMPAALMLADVVVHASTRPEAFGRVVIEAQAMGRPVIASDLGGPVETVEHGVTGWRVPPGDAAALAEAIEAALALPEEERAALGERARERGAARLHRGGDAGGDAGGVPGGAGEVDDRAGSATLPLLRSGGGSGWQCRDSGAGACRTRDLHRRRPNAIDSASHPKERSPDPCPPSPCPTVPCAASTGR